MAQKFDDFNKVYAAVLKNAKRAAILAAKETAKHVLKDMHILAIDGLNHYYAEYDPDYYDRTYHLKDAISDIYNDNSTDEHISIEVGIKYDESKLENHYYSGSKKNPQYPEPEWILDNFLEGIHPRTTKGRKYNPAHFITTQTIEMNNFIENKAEKLIDKYMNAALLREFTKRMK